MSCATSHRVSSPAVWPKLIIHRFEVIEVEENHGEGVPKPMKAADFLFQANEEEAAVVKVCHLVLKRQIFQTAVRGFKVFVGRVELSRERIDLGGLVLDGCDCSLCPTGFPGAFAVGLDTSGDECMVSWDMGTDDLSASRGNSRLAPGEILTLSIRPTVTACARDSTARPTGLHGFFATANGLHGSWSHPHRQGRGRRSLVSLADSDQ
jgi:hypothetical protein